ncbi:MULTISPECIES: DUF3298 and DUF4163 domain-containing protein [Brevibacillus]|uniref:DUF3298 domain-containing protein n=1 Tax=Brevibacillus parabrevis TaxID=54914 RepID=A0A4Y3PGY4_BREPA|nr:MULTISPECIES: DUF3298 and DUF4163 domain-containing protein [Brevibacillus]NRQ53275.1 DUF3298 and DUF4163 domain-containing protein [Brevibacillus sp. HD1.4A]MBU8713482.1 DUF3298 and DUF4163 domain-containing protein [Brevibacillus parabrevis]MDH6351072.1 hypothetical protein [Brevibacillus sp. 1238]MDR4997683.1 DUF3298 domain-containing protein [Brevibacillus parabrevis]MED1722597.1 DUF3298 domain-containing protein [Brevibacillus parabrevis]
MEEQLNLLPATVLTRTINRPNTTIYYPQLAGLANQQAEKDINRAILQTVQGLIHEQQRVQVPGNTQMQGSFEIKTNERGIFSVTLSNYAYTPQMAHGMTFLGSVTANTQTGKLYTLRDLFKPGSDYVTVLSENIKRQIKERDIPTLGNFTTIKPDQDFYLADKSLVIYFQLYEITPYYVGFPMFPISVYDLQSIIDESGPLGILSAS